MAISFDALYRNISSDPEKDKIYTEIVRKNKMYWNRFHDEKEILAWVQNFRGSNEIKHALILANNVIYFTKEECRHLWNVLLSNYLKDHFFQKMFDRVPSSNINEWYINYLRERCVFVGFGEAQESSNEMVYELVKSHRIDGLCYKNLTQLKHFINLDEIEHVILVDDFIGTGHQSCDFWHEEVDNKSLEQLSRDHSHLNFIYLALVGYIQGKEYIESRINIEVILGQELNETFKCFSEASSIYPNPEIREEAKGIMERKGRILVPDAPLGYGDLQLAIAFCHNTPDNSLPVIWADPIDRSWIPLFARR